MIFDFVLLEIVLCYRFHLDGYGDFGRASSSFNIENI